MPADTQQILDAASKLADLVAQHPAIENYRKAQKALADDPDASRSMSEFNRTLETLGRQEAQGMPVTDAQRTQLESLQGRIVSNIKVKAWNMAEVELMDLLRKVNQTVLSKISDAAPGAAHAGGPGAGAGVGARLVR
jgi:cell fate (sporulation/competence/biofilm development) regulator YlbF (YheA/YmcA/DUF963 family)